MNDYECNGQVLARAIWTALDGVAQTRALPVVNVIAALGSVAAFAVHVNVNPPDSSSDLLGEMALMTSFRDGLAALRAPTPPEPVPLSPRKRSRTSGRR